MNNQLEFISSEKVQELSPMASLIDAIKAAFQNPPETPTRHHHTMAAGREELDATLLLMPAWRPGRCVGVKVATVFPGASSQGLPAVQATYLLSDGRTGKLIAIMDGTMLTARRTAAASALASRFLSRQDADTLLMVGTGALAPHLIEAHCVVRPIRKVLLWGRDPLKAESRRAEWQQAEGLFGDLDIQCVQDLQAAVGQADIISCATLAESPLILGDWLQPGVHLDLVGGFKPTMRECDSEAVRRSQVFVDTRAGALSEAGDLIQPIKEGVLHADDVLAELSELVQGSHGGRTGAHEITLFKSVGASLEDLAAAEMVLSNSASELEF